MRYIAFFTLAAVLIAGAIAYVPVRDPARAAPNPASDHIAPVTAELLVFESENCSYCFIFRRDVAPGYIASPRARDVPLRYIDVSKADLTDVGLRAPLTLLPTIVLMKEGREVDRITGYMGPEPFYHMVSRLMK